MYEKHYNFYVKIFTCQSSLPAWWYFFAPLLMNMDKHSARKKTPPKPPPLWPSFFLDRSTYVNAQIHAAVVGRIIFL
jgi:hypothetical protein